MRALRSSLALFLLLTFSVVAASPVAAHDGNYVAPTDLPPALLSRPPDVFTFEWWKQARMVEQAQRHMPDADLGPLTHEQHMRISLMTDILDDNFVPERLPRTFDLLHRVYDDASRVVEVDKNFYATRRPYLLDKNVKLKVDPIDKSPAYPSGHTCESRVLAEVIGMLLPDRSEDLRNRANEIAWHRVEAGVHYPNDLEGGRMLAMLIVGALLANDDFQSDLAAARDEIASQK